MRFFTSFRMTTFQIPIKVGLLLLFMVTVLQSFSETILVGGIMEESETWTNENTYLVFQDLIIPDGIVLTIEHGVTVKFDFGRGIISDKGTLRVSGTITDSVKFIPNHSNPGQTWRWKGIVINNATFENNNFIHYALISEAETAIKVENCQNVIVENSSLVNSQNFGIRFYNTSSSSIANCNIENNYNGIEIVATNLGVSSHNVIYNCIVKNQNHNIYVFIDKEGVFQNNIISKNIIGSANNGIWLEDSEGTVVSDNSIEQNIILNNGTEVGYGIFLTQNSTIVTNNIFWRNNIAIFCEQNGSGNSIINNSFYQNSWAVTFATMQEDNRYLNNTFSLNSNVLMALLEAQDIVFSNNNIMNTDGLENIVINNTKINFLIPDNYWGTIDTTKINKLIYDKLDNPELGKMEYKPYINSIDTSNPIAPPYHVIKQKINNRIHFSWHANEELDLMGYRIYSGNYANYSFTESSNIGKDTTFVFPGDISINNYIAVTAYDSVATTNAQLEGHESPFAFAVMYPYAGNDTLICNNLLEIKIENSNIPLQYNSLFWSTSGNGFFSNPYIITPEYFPGSVDIQNGGALISLNVVVENDTIIDSFRFIIIDDPIAFAGNDTTIFADEEISLIEANAQNFDDVFWVTNGDGNFNNDTLLNPIYYPGEYDIESGDVFLKMIAYSSCGFSADSMKVNIGSYYSVEGKLWSSQKSLSPGRVIAFRKIDDGTRATQIESVESNGTFKFDELLGGNYYIYALPDTNYSDSDNVVPGYYANKLRWQSAYILTVDADVYDVDIHLPSVDFTLPVGEASISGHMEIPMSFGTKSKYNKDIYCTPWFDLNNNDFCRGGFANNTVLLFNYTKSKLLDYTLTDEVGNFYFNQLPYGNYIVDAEKAGLISIASQVITLSPEHKNETDVIIEISEQNLKISNFNNMHGDVTATVFPNPALTEINIPYSNPLLLASQLEIFDLCRNLVLSYNMPIEKTYSITKVKVNSLSAGLYFGQIINSNKTIYFRFIKR